MPTALPRLVLAIATLTVAAVAGARPSGEATSASVGATPPSIPASEAFAAGSCAVCHAVPDAPAEPRISSCSTCHVWIKDVAASPARRAKAMEIFPLWERYERSVASYLEVPSLDAAMARLDPEWVRSYLADPHDLRPHLSETMPRFDLSAPQIDAIVQAFAQARATVPSTPAPDAARIAQGEALFTERGCAACHTFGGRHTTAAVPMAPDLAHARERMSPDHLAAWIVDPRSVSPAATMPPSGLSADQALAVRDYLLLADPQASPAPALGPMPAPTTEPVRWAQVEERVFGRICQHCHMNPDLNQGRAGPGNDGGFGFAATGIELQTRQGVMAVAPRIADALARRRAEASRDHVGPGHAPTTVTRPERPGMPLGLPPLSDEDTALVLGWIAQGMPE